MSPYDIMQSRWMKLLFETLPNVDIKDLLKTRGLEVQFDSQYSQKAYESMLEKEKRLGNYLTLN